MSGAKVVDASALAALLFAEPEAENIAKRLEGARLSAPSLLDFELANVCLTKMRRQSSERDAIRAAFRLAHRLKVETIAVDHTAIVDLAEATGLTAYDASYLWLARALSRDSRFGQRNGHALLVEVVNSHGRFRVKWSGSSAHQKTPVAVSVSKV